MDLTTLKMALSQNPLNVDSLFRDACRHGRLDCAQWLLETYPNIDPHSKNSYAFRYACEGGYLELAKWLAQLDNLDVHANNEDAFVSACKCGHLEVVKWLNETFPYIEKKIGDYETFRTACLSGNLEMAKFLASLWPEVYRICSESFFRFLLVRGQLDVADWLLEKIPETKLSEYLFLEFCDCGNKRLAQWYVKHFQVRTLYNRAFMDVCIIGSLDLAKWLLETFPDINLKEGYILAKFRQDLPFLRWFLEIQPELFELSAPE